MSSKNKNEACSKLEDILKIEDKYFIPSTIIIEDKGVGTKLIFVYIGNYIDYTKWLDLPEEKILNLKNLIERNYNGKVINDCVLVPNSYYSKFKGEATLDIRKKILGKFLGPQLDKAYKRFKQLENDGTYSSDEKSPYLFNRLVLKYIFDTYQSLKIPLPAKYKNLSAVPKDKGYFKKRIFIHPLQDKSEDREILEEAPKIKSKPRGVSKLSIKRYKKVIEECIKFEKEGMISDDEQLFNELSKIDYFNKTYRPATIKDILDKKKYNKEPTKEKE